MNFTFNYDKIIATPKNAIVFESIKESIMIIRKSFTFILTIISLCFAANVICSANEIPISASDMPKDIQAAEIDSTAEVGTSSESDFTYTVNDQSCYITGYTGSATELIIPAQIDGYTVKTISDRAFSGNKTLVSVKLPDTLTSIGGYAFSGCTSLSSIALPDSITTLYYAIFSGCTALTSINVPISLVNCHTSYNGQGIFSGSSITNVTIPDTITKIPNYLFYAYTTLTNVLIPDSVEVIGESAFSGCTSLAEITLPKGLTAIEYRAFYGSTALRSIELPENTETVKGQAFRGCTNLNSVIFSDSITALESYAFEGCASLTSIDLPSKLITIGDYAFSGCKLLSSVKLYDSLTTIGSYAFSGCTALEDVKLPSSLKTILDHAFSGCTSLSSIALPDSITTLYYAIFSGCTALTSINVPISLVNCHTSYNGQGIFSGSSITNVTIPDTITKIPNYLFYAYTTLTNVLIPDSVEVIGESAFSGCTSLAEITLPKGLTAIEYQAFRDCDLLETIFIPKSVVTFHKDAFYGCQNVTVLCYSNSAAHLALENTEYKFILIDNHDHDYTVIEETNANCTAGSYKKSICNICQYVLIEKGEPLGHNLTSEVVPPTCQSAGYTMHVCVVCNYSFSDSHVNHDPELHNYSPWVTSKEPTIFADGLQTRRCSVCDNTEEKVIPKITVDVNTNKNYGIATFKVIHAQTLKPIGEAQILVSTKAGEHTFVTDSNGDCSMVLPVGKVTASFIAKDCLVRNLELEIKHGTNVFDPVGLSELNGYDVKISSRIMSLDEIIAVGIDISDLANQHVVEYELQIKFKSEIDYASILAYFNSEGICVGTIQAPKVDINTPDDPTATGKPIYTLHYHVVTGGFSHSYCEIVEVSKGEKVKLDYTPERNSDDYVFDGWYGDASLTSKISTVEINNLETTVFGKWIYVGEGEEPKFGFGDFGISLPLGDEMLTVYPASENFYLIVRGEVKWLKEMFDVEMLIVNNSMTDTLENLTAKLTLPSGLSLPALFGEEQPLSKYVGNLGHGECRSIHWYIRGDTAGSYSLKATLTGKVMSFNEEINDTFVSAENLHVYAGNALHLNFSFPSATYEGEDYPMIITLTNVSDITLYNVHNLFVIKQGMTVYYSDGTSKVKWKITNYRRSEIKEFKPGDKLIIELSMDIFFHSEVIEAQAQKYIKDLTELEKLWNMYKAANELDDRLNIFFDSVNGCMSAVEKYTDSIGISDSKSKLASELLKNLKGLKLALSGSEDDVSRAADNSVTSIVLSVINALSENPEKWISESKDSDIKSLCDSISALTRAIKSNEKQASSFNVFESLRKAISAIPIKFAIESVVMIPKSTNTTVIPWSYTASETDVRYFGVSNVSSYIISLTKAIAGTYFDGIAPVELKNSPFFKNGFDTDGATENIKAAENELEAFKVSDTTGKKTFKAWVRLDGTASKYTRLSGISKNSSDGYTLFSDNGSAVFENGVLTFSGAGWVYLIPNEAADYVLYIESDDGTLFTYHIEVVKAHTCISGGKNTVLSPSEYHDGFAIECCNICGEIMDIITLDNESICKEHAFGEWQTVVAATCTEGGIRSRICNVCGYKESEIVPSTAHSETEKTVIEPTCTDGGYTVYSCLCKEHSHTGDKKPASAHRYDESGVCELCGEEKPTVDTECDCKCHRKGIAGFFFRIFEFFRRIFGTRHVCDCTKVTLCIPRTKEFKY